MISKLKLIACVGINAVLDDRVNQNDNRIFTMKLKMNTKKNQPKTESKQKNDRAGIEYVMPVEHMLFCYYEHIFFPSLSRFTKRK